MFKLSIVSIIAASDFGVASGLRLSTITANPQNGAEQTIEMNKIVAAVEAKFDQFGQEFCDELKESRQQMEIRMAEMERRMAEKNAQMTQHIAANMATMLTIQHPDGHETPKYHHYDDTQRHHVELNAFELWQQACEEMTSENLVQKHVVLNQAQNELSSACTSGLTADMSD